MKFFILSLAVAFFSLVSSKSYAAVHANNGGAVVKCGYVEEMVVDLFLAKKDPSFEMRFQDGDVFERAQESIDLFKKFDPELFKHFTKKLMQIRGNVSFGDPIPESSAGTFYYWPDGESCEHKFVAIQNKYGLLISKSWWKSTSFENKLALILHEIVYSYAIKFDLWIAWHVSPMVKFLLDSKSHLASQSEYNNLKKELKWDGLYYFNTEMPLYLNSLYVADDEFLISGVLAREHSFYPFIEDAWMNGENRLPRTELKKDSVVFFGKSSFNWETTRFQYVSAGYATVIEKIFYSGKIARCENTFKQPDGILFEQDENAILSKISSAHKFTHLVTLVHDRLKGAKCVPLQISQNRIEFHPQVPKELFLTEPALLEAGNFADELYFQGQLRFDAKGRVRFGTLAKDGFYHCMNSPSPQFVSAGSTVEFREDGNCK